MGRRRVSSPITMISRTVSIVVTALARNWLIASWRAPDVIVLVQGVELFPFGAVVAHPELAERFFVEVAGHEIAGFDVSNTRSSSIRPPAKSSS